MKILRNTSSKTYERFVLQSLADLKWYMVVLILLFAIGIAVGYVNPFDIQRYVVGIMDTLVSRFEGLHGFELFFKIFLQNSKATAFILASGVIFSLFPLMATIINGVVIGVVIEHLKYSRAMSPALGALSLIPHGLFEIPAIVIALSLGVKFGSWPFRKNRIEFIKNHLVISIKCYLLIILPLLLIAGIIETLGIEVLISLRS